MTRLLAFALLLTAAARAQPAPDASFADNGFALVKLTATSVGGPVVVQSDGSTLLVVEGRGEDKRDTYFVRLLRDGRPDPAWGSSGERLIEWPDSLYRAEIGLTTSADLMVLSDGRIALVTSLLRADDQLLRGAVAVFNRSGFLDASFGQGGVAFPGLSLQARINRIAETPQGIVGVGTASFGSPNRAFAFRLSPDGAADSTFGVDGITRIDASQLTDIVALADGRTLATGWILNPGFQSIDDDAIFVRLDENGQLASENGRIQFDMFGSSIDRAISAVVLADGSALVSGWTRLRDSFPGYGTTLYRLLPDGSFDFGYGNEGWTWTETSAYSHNFNDTSFPFQTPSGRLGVAETTTEGLLILEQNADGSPADEDAAGGITLLFGDRAPLFSTSLVITPDGEPVASGFTSGDEEGLVTPFVLRALLSRPVAAEVLPEATLALSVAPNPVQGAARISFALGAPAEARITVVDALGRTVAVLADARLGAGDHAFSLDAARLPAGVYAVVARLGAEQTVRRVTVVR